MSTNKKSESKPARVSDENNKDPSSKTGASSSPKKANTKDDERKE